jgi:3-deoxy-D-manno-octulosonic-acid transferase
MALYNKISRQLYTLIYCLVFPGVLTRLLWRSRISKEYRKRWNERFGFITPVPEGTQSIWIHAVSVGETIAAVPLIKALIERFPNYNVVVTTSTPTGSAQVSQNLKNQVIHYYSPFDISSCVNRFIHRTNTKFCIIMETELWPNLLHCCHQSKVPILLANARLSEKSRRRYRLIPFLTKPMLETYSMVAAQGKPDGKRFVELGLNPNNMIVTGNIKFDIPISHTLIEQGKVLRSEWGSSHRPTFIAASTHEGEEEIVLDAFDILRKKNPDILLVLVPRHPERFAKVAKLCEKRGCKIVLRSQKQPIEPDTQIMLGDTMGELRLIYAACDVAFVGGSLIPIGGHNLIEPASLGLPVLTGPNLQNFVVIGRILQEAGVAQIVHDAKSMAHQVSNLLALDHVRKEIAMKAHQVIIANQGALAKHLEWIQKNIHLWATE